MSRSKRNPPKRSHTHYWSLRDCQSKYWERYAQESSEEKSSQLVEENKPSPDSLHSEEAPSGPHQEMAKAGRVNQNSNQRKNTFKLNLIRVEDCQENISRNKRVTPKIASPVPKECVSQCSYGNIFSQPGKPTSSSTCNEGNMLSRLQKPNMDVTSTCTQGCNQPQVGEDDQKIQGCGKNRKDSGKPTGSPRSDTGDSSHLLISKSCKRNCQLENVQKVDQFVISSNDTITPCLPLPAHLTSKTSSKESRPLENPPKSSISNLEKEGTQKCNSYKDSKNEESSNFDNLANIQESQEFRKRSSFIQNLKKSLMEFENSNSSGDSFQNSEISGTSSVEKRSKVKPLEENSKDEDFSDSAYKSLFKQYKMQPYRDSLYLQNHKRSLSEADHFRNYVIQETNSSAENSPSEKPIIRGKYFKNMGLCRQATLGASSQNSQGHSQLSQEANLIEIVRSLADIEQKIGSKKTRSKKGRRRKPKTKKTFSSSSTFKSLFVNRKINDSY